MRENIVMLDLLGALIPVETLSAVAKTTCQLGQLSIVKSIVNPDAGWDVTYETTWSSPTAYLVNSVGPRRSDTTTLNNKKII